MQDKTNKGESGTLADAASPLSNPKIIYTGGANNGAASGILRSTDMGGTALSGSISTVLTGLSWICAGIHRRGALPSPVLA